MLIPIIFLAIGFILLLAGAEFLVRGASSLAKNMGVSPLVIGLTVVAFGTSAPEFVVNLIAALRGTADIGLGNVIGSNIANILLILGIGASIMPMKIKRGTVWREIPFAFLASLLILIMTNDRIIDGELTDTISRIDGLVLVSLFIIFMYYVFAISKTKNTNDTDIATYTTTISVVLSLIGIGGLALGGHMLVGSAVTLATLAGISEVFIGLTVVAVGTSLPELATVIVSSMKKQTDLAIGNVVGSNIFNIFWIVGGVSIIQPLSANLTIQADIVFSVVVTGLLFSIMFIGKRLTLERYQGYLFTALYAFYIVFLVMRG